MKQRDYLKEKKAYKKEDVPVNTEVWQRTSTRYTKNGYMTERQLKEHEKRCRQAEHLIYNDLSTDVLFPLSSTMDRYNEGVAERLMLKGEEYVRLSTKATSIIFTSFARMINTHTVRQLKPSITNQSIIIYVDSNSFRSIDLFKEYGWDHNIDDLTKRYMNHGWVFNNAKAATSRRRRG